MVLYKVSNSNLPAFVVTETPCTEKKNKKRNREKKGRDMGGERENKEREKTKQTQKRIIEGLVLKYP